MNSRREIADTGSSMSNKRAAARYAAPVVLLGAVLVLWEFAVRVLDVPIYLVPAPSRVLLAVGKHYPSLVADAGITLGEAALGFILGASFAFVIGTAFVQSRIVEQGLAPYFVALQAVPIVATAPLLIIWFGNGLLSKVIMAAMICFFPMVINSAAGLGSVPSEALDLMRILSASRTQVFFKLRLPASLPFLFSGLRISATLSVIGAVVAEMAGANKGIGFQIMVSSYQTDTPMLFSAVIFSAAIGIVFYYGVSWIEMLATGRRYAYTRS